MSKTLVFDAASHHKLIEGGETIHGGQEFTVDDDRALELLTQPGLSIKEAGGSLRSLKKSELEELATASGLNPSDYRTKNDLVDAIENQREAGGGAAQETTTEEV